MRRLGVVTRDLGLGSGGESRDEYRDERRLSGGEQQIQATASRP